MMIASVLQTLTALEAHGAASMFLSDNMPDRFCATSPSFDKTADYWRVRVILSYPFIGSVGEVGEIIISSTSEEILSHTPLDEMRSRALSLYEQHREAIEAAFSQSRNSYMPRTPRSGFLPG